MNIIEREVKSVLNTRKHIDSWFWTKYAAYPYIGCIHNCTYCYAAADKYTKSPGIEEFGKQIIVKKNAPEVLRRQLKRKKPDIISTGSWQVINKKYNLSRKMLQVCYNYGFPVKIITKTDAILDDIDLIEKINEKTWACVSFSIIAGTNKKIKLLKKFEPKAPGVEKRFEAMRELSERGILTGVCAMPILPFLFDDEENMKGIIKMTKEHGGKYIIPAGLTLGGEVAKRYYKHLKEFPEVLKKTKNMYPNASYEPTGDWSKDPSVRFNKICKKEKMSTRIPRWIPNDERSENYKKAEIMHNKAYFLDLEGKKQEAWKYRREAWELEEKKIEKQQKLSF